MNGRLLRAQNLLEVSVLELRDAQLKPVYLQMVRRRKQGVPQGFIPSVAESE